MIIEDAFKDKQTLKCQDFDSTINNILSGFKKLGLNILINSEIKNRRINSYSCSSHILGLNFSASGKGTTKKQALTSALAELTERFSANLFFKYMYPDYDQITSELILRFINGEHMTGYEFSHQDDLINKVQIEEILKNYSISLTKKQLEHLKNLDISKHWVDGYSFISKKNIKIPLRLIQKINGSNGLASGNRIEEAIVQASCELFERHSVNEIFSKQIITPTFDNATIGNKTINKILKNYEKNNIEVLIKDFSLNNLLPVVAVVFKNNNLKDTNSFNYQFEYLQVNAGSSFNLKEAILRCFTERISGLDLSMFKKGLTQIYEDNLIKKLGPKITTTNSLYGLFKRFRFGGDKTFLCKGKVVPFTQFNENFNFLTEINHIKEISEKLKTDFIIVNHTHPIMRFPTVRVIIPGYSNVLNYVNYEFDDLLNLIEYGSTNSDFIHMYSKNDWLRNRKYYDILEHSILSNYIQLNESKILNVCNELNSVKEGLLILASIYYEMKNYEKFRTVAKMISKRLSSDLRKKYLYLYYLTNYYLKTRNDEIIPLIDKAYNKLKGCERFFHSQQLKNPFTTWCDKKCEQNCKEKYLTSLNTIIESFFVNYKTNDDIRIK